MMLSKKILKFFGGSITLYVAMVVIHFFVSKDISFFEESYIRNLWIFLVSFYFYEGILSKKDNRRRD